MVKFAIVFISVCLFILIFALVNNSKNIIAKVVFSNIFTTLIATMIVLLGTFYNEPNFIDLSIIYILVGFSVSATLLFFVSTDWRQNTKE